MNKRDLKADLEICNKATPGPWRAGESFVEDNMRFVAQAREGWPHAIERALKAEALAQKLLNVLGRVIPRYLAGRLELDLDLVLEANGLLKNPKEVLSDDKVHAGRQSKGAKDY